MPTPLPIKELGSIVLTTPIPEHNLRPGDIGTVVHVHNNGEAYEVEFCTFTGYTVALITLKAAQVRPPAHDELPTARRIAG